LIGGTSRRKTADGIRTFNQQATSSIWKIKKPYVLGCPINTDLCLKAKHAGVISDEIWCVFEKIGSQLPDIIRRNSISTLAYNSFSSSQSQFFTMVSIYLAFILFAAILNVCHADLHHLFVGNLNAPSSIHVLVFDDDALTLNKTATLKAANPHSWIAFDVTLPSPFF
jgi:hypothetical protein